MEALTLACLIIIIILLAADKFRIVKRNKPMPEKEQQKNLPFDIMGATRPVRYSQATNSSNVVPDAETVTNEDKSNIEDAQDIRGYLAGKVAVEDETDSNPDWEEEEAKWPSQDVPEDDGFASGVTFEELVDVNRLLARDRLDKQQQKQAVETLVKVQGTEIFNLLQNSINGASQRIADLLDAYVIADHRPASPNKHSGDTEGFDIGAFV